MRGIAILLLLGLAGCDGRPALTEQGHLFSEAQDAVKSILKDGESARFEEMSQCGSSRYVTGKVNAKNSFGAYSGFSTFVFNGLTAYTVEVSSDSFVKELNECTKHISENIGKPLDQ